MLFRSLVSGHSPHPPEVVVPQQESLAQSGQDGGTNVPIAPLIDSVVTQDVRLSGTEVLQPQFFAAGAGPDGAFDAGFTREQILGIAQAIDGADMAWMYDTIVDHSTW